MQEQNQLIDLSQIDQISSGDPNFRNEMIGIFTDQIPVFIENIQNFWKNKELENLAREVHTAKSSVLIFGMEITGHNLKEIQLLAENKEVEKIQELIEKVVKDLTNALHYLSRLQKS
jgi:HPt (histidine-containing phosphotransfer) domain-containing protein